jgi:hypothetical protein
MRLASTLISRPDTPLRWINYLGSQDFFGIISNTAGGHSFFRDARMRRLTRYRYNTGGDMRRRPHSTIVWVGLDGDEIVIGKLMRDQKVANIERDPRVTFSMEADGEQWGHAVPPCRRRHGGHHRRGRPGTAS